ncbi:unnamed protein product [Bursaphelenchus xylophilus]|uniref:(pine wood nematode) hypothetical protein n=1 Tax=Bursaphelenchus xylophilus TaxID=6326 RepID=A0A1I7SST1_BURXY|nr:unnamed protein product [Bursaphelenchus xylophilus]CAG9108891.1 unnamed protein product [Bursaphelenchus xylophilus]
MMSEDAPPSKHAKETKVSMPPPNNEIAELEPVQEDQNDDTINGNTRTKICTNPEMAQIAAKVESFKNWTVNRFKTTKQSVFEQLGKVEKTVDSDMDQRINNLKDLHNRYKDVLNAAKTYSDHIQALNNSQRILSESLYQLSLKENDLKQTLTDRSEVLRSFSHNGDALIKSIGHFVSSLETLSNKTIKDTMWTIQVYEQARLEFDVYRHELSTLKQNVDADQTKIPDVESRCNEHKKKYEQLKEDVRVKIALLDENRLKVMRTQLKQLEDGLSHWFGENIKTLEQSSPREAPNHDDLTFSRGEMEPSSFLEQ